MKRKLTHDIFNGKPSEIVVACVDYDGLLKFGDDPNIRHTWASERWRGANWLEKIADTDFEPLTFIRRHDLVA
jgi:hypothetical protein